jgi:protein-arginine kinase activator protein McsA
MASEIIVFNSDEFEELITNKDVRIAQALVDTILSNLKGRKRHLHALSVLVEQEQTIYDITVDRKEFITTLKQNLPTLEENELYESCALVRDALIQLESK